MVVYIVTCSFGYEIGVFNEEDQLRAKNRHKTENV